MGVKDMRERRCLWLSTLFLALLMMAGCAHVISTDMRQQAREDLSFPMVLENPTRNIGDTIILGGVVIESFNREEGTELLILETLLAGEILGKETRPLGETHYGYPVIQVRELHLWREVIRHYSYDRYYGRPYPWRYTRYHRHVW
jgi:outer membrane lipoprotein